MRRCWKQFHPACHCYGQLYDWHVSLCTAETPRMVSPSQSHTITTHKQKAPIWLFNLTDHALIFSISPNYPLWLEGCSFPEHTTHTDTHTQITLPSVNKHIEPLNCKKGQTLMDKHNFCPCKVMWAQPYFRYAQHTGAGQGDRENTNSHSKVTTDVSLKPQAFPYEIRRKKRWKLSRPRYR